LPNYCDCELKLEGPCGDLDQIEKMWGGRKGLPRNENRRSGDDSRRPDLDIFNHIVPMPKDIDLHEEYPPGGMPQWFNWRVENWGTKWEPSEVEVKRKKLKEMKITFNTAWSPPCPIIIVLGRMFPKVVFKLKYYDGLGGFKGYFEVAKSEVTVDETSKYHGKRGG